jgi:uncharacterized membrane protein
MDIDITIVRLSVLIPWLFTIGFCRLGFWQSVLALVLWPYYLGAALRAPRERI